MKLPLCLSFDFPVAKSGVHVVYLGGDFRKQECRGKKNETEGVLVGLWL